jgi:hypothetical protein
MFRQGDILIEAVQQIPAEAKRKETLILAEGELTGHRHQIAEPANAELYELDGTLYLRVAAERATVIHTEHKAITLERGVYRVWRQREYSPQAIRYVED